MFHHTDFNPTMSRGRIATLAQELQPFIKASIWEASPDHLPPGRLCGEKTPAPRTA
jgi:hypothetical protein